MLLVFFYMDFLKERECLRNSTEGSSITFSQLSVGRPLAPFNAGIPSRGAYLSRKSFCECHSQHLGPHSPVHIPRATPPPPTALGSFLAVLSVSSYFMAVSAQSSLVYCCPDIYMLNSLGLSHHLIFLLIFSPSYILSSLLALPYMCCTPQFISP